MPERGQQPEAPDTSTEEAILAAPEAGKPSVETTPAHVDEDRPEIKSLRGLNRRDLQAIVDSGEPRATDQMMSVADRAEKMTRVAAAQEMLSRLNATKKNDQPAAPSPSASIPPEVSRWASGLTAPQLDAWNKDDFFRADIDKKQAEEDPVLNQAILEAHESLAANYARLTPEERQQSLQKLNRLLAQEGSKPVDESEIAALASAHISATTPDSTETPATPPTPPRRDAGFMSSGMPVLDAAKPSAEPTPELQLMSVGAANPEDLTPKEDVPPTPPRRAAGFVPSGMAVHEAASVIPEMIRPAEEKPAPDVLEVTKADMQPFRAVLEKKEKREQGAPEVAADLEAKEQKEKKAELAQRELDDARAAYGTALRSKQKWYGAASQKELDEARERYQLNVAESLRAAVGDVRRTFEGKDIQDPAVQGEFLAQLTDVTISHRMAEEQRLRESMRGGEHARVLDKMRTWWKKSAKVRFAVGAGLAVTGVAGAVTGQIWLTGLAAGARAAMSGTGTFLMSESAMQGARKRFGSTKELTPDEIEAMGQPWKDEKTGMEWPVNTCELEERIAAHTMLQVDDNLKEFGVRETGVLKWKKQDPTGARLLNRYDAVLRQIREEEIKYEVKRGVKPEDIIANLVARQANENTYLHQSYLRRIHQNKVLNAGIFVSSAILGGLAAIPGVSSAMNAREHLVSAHAVKEFGAAMHQATPEPSHVAGAADMTHAASPHSFSEAMSHAQAEPDQTTAGLVASHEHLANGAAAHESVNTSWADHRLEDDTILTTAQEHVYTAKAGDSVWTLAKHYVADHYPNMSEEQKTWMIDAMKDKAVAHPEFVGLQAGLHPGQSIDFTKLGLDVPSLAQKATRLSQEAVHSIHENLIHHVDGGTAAPLEHVTTPDVHAATAADTVTAHAPTSTEAAPLSLRPSAPTPHRLADLPVMIQDKSGNLVDLNQHLPDVHAAVADTAHAATHLDTHAPMIENLKWTPDLRHQMDSYLSHREYWQKFEADPKAFKQANDVLNTMSIEQAGRPGELEKVLRLAHGKDQAFERDMAESIRALVKKVHGVSPKESLWKFLEYLHQDLPK